MEDIEAVPAPNIITNGYDKPEIDESAVEKTDFDIVIDNTYSFSVSKKGEKIIFKIKIKNVVMPINYEFVCDSKYMNKISKIFSLCSNLEEVYQALISGLKECSKEIKIELVNDKAVCNFILDIKFLKKKENHTIMLAKKKGRIKHRNIK